MTIAQAPRGRAGDGGEAVKGAQGVATGRAAGHGR